MDKTACGSSWSRSAAARPSETGGQCGFLKYLQKQNLPSRSHILDSVSLAAVTNHHKRGVSNNSHLLSHSSGGWGLKSVLIKPKPRTWQGCAPMGGSGGNSVSLPFPATRAIFLNSLAQGAPPSVSKGLDVASVITLHSSRSTPTPPYRDT